MILEELVINNFRVFEGRHTFDLIPRRKYNKKRPIILFGGLNGTGKTTYLTAVRLALYGKQSLGKGITQGQYFDYLEKSIHRNSKINSSQTNYSTIELTFSYASMGAITHYTVKRNWVIGGSKKGLSEKLTISENGNLLDELNDEQCQGFLNELIPIGVSDLFFFDGEKIAELAEDTKGDALGESIKKLLGLDIIETLEEDLGIFLRKESKKGSELEVKKQISILEDELTKHEKEAHFAIELFNQSLTAQRAYESELENLENQLSSRGGAWAANREEAIKKQTALIEEQRFIEESIRETLSASYPISIAADFAKKTLAQLKCESVNKQHTYTAQILDKIMRSLTQTLSDSLNDKNLEHVKNAINNQLSEFSSDGIKVEILHDISDTLLASIEIIIDDALTKQKTKLQELNSRLIYITGELDKAGKNIARAPEQAKIKPLADKISKIHQKRAKSIAVQKEHIEIHKRHLRDAIVIAKQLEKLTSIVTSNIAQTRTLLYATRAKELLKDFASEMAQRKVNDLESEFIISFSRLARKEDINLSASIDPKKYTVCLLDQDGRKINKDELSAGEKQIYAISILEALARTSGRRLPVIIDTPLGRLDSIHRTKLINNYFPFASHQVIILSTDTEVDEAFYADLSPNISHAFKLDYDAMMGSTTAEEGYFWRDIRSKAS